MKLRRTKQSVPVFLGHPVCIVAKWNLCSWA